MEADASRDPAASLTGSTGASAHVGRKSVLALVGNIAGAAFGYLQLLAIGRYFGPGPFGMMLFSISVVGVVAAFSNLGYNQAHTREVARGVPLRAALGVYVRIQAVLTILMALVVGAALWGWTSFLDQPLTDTTLGLMAGAILLAVIGDVWVVFANTWMGLGHVNRQQTGGVAAAAVTTIIIVLAGLGVAHAAGRWTPVPGLAAGVADALRLQARPTVPQLAGILLAARVLGLGSAALTGAYWAIRDRLTIGPWDAVLARDYTRFAMPLVLTAGMTLILQHTDILMLGFFWSDVAVGHYGAAQRLSSLALLANTALIAVLFPVFARLHAVGQEEEARRVFRLAERYLLLFCVPIAVAMMSLPRQGLEIGVGQGFIPAAAPLQWLAGLAIVRSLQMPVHAMFMGVGRSGLVMRSSLINAAANIVLNLVLIPASILGVPLAGMGATGAAIATFASTALAYGWNRWTARRLFGIALFDHVQLRFAAAGVATGAFWVLGARVLPPTALDRVWELGAAGAVGLALYFIVLFAVQGLRREDVARLRGMVSPRGLWREMRGT